MLSSNIIFIFSELKIFFSKKSFLSIIKLELILFEKFILSPAEIFNFSVIFEG